jgi:hypothetical protein
MLNMWINYVIYSIGKYYHKIRFTLSNPRFSILSLFWRTEKEAYGIILLSVSVCSRNFLLGGLRDRLALCVRPVSFVFSVRSVSYQGCLWEHPAVWVPASPPLIFSFSMTSVSYQSKAGDYFFQELLVLYVIYNLNAAENVIFGAH